MLKLHGQKFPSEGGVDSHSVTYFLGKHSLSQVEVLARESIQNSWDARDAGNITYRAEEKLLTKAQTRFVLLEVLGERPCKGLVRELESYVCDGRLPVVCVTDSGTRGLGGPVRANVAAHGRRTDFVDFVRNIGRSASKGPGGGTYGLGKAALFDASSVGVCIVFTQTYQNGQMEPRFIAMSMGDDDYEENCFRYTGRNWWGDATDEPELVDPAMGHRALKLAQSSGVPSPGESETGTSVMILAPRLELMNGAGCIAEGLEHALRKWTWPRLLGEERADISVEVHAQDGKIAKVEPEKKGRLSRFISTYHAAEDRGHPLHHLERRVTLKSGRITLGVLAIRVVPKEEPTDDEFDNYVALMRKPRQVVKYLNVPGLPDGSRVQGVFIADDDLDTLFAQAEPAAHDNWVPERTSTEAGRRNYVRIALAQIPKQIKDWGLELNPPEADGQSSGGATRLSSALGNLITGITGQGGERQPTKRSARRSQRSAVSRPSVAPAGSPSLSVEGGRIVCSATFRVTKGGNSDACYGIQALASVVTDGGGVESNPPVGAWLPEFLRWESTEGLFEDPTLRLENTMDTEVSATFALPPDVEVRIEAEIRELTSA